MAFLAPMFSFDLSLLDDPINRFGLKLIEFAHLGNGDNRAIRFMLLNGKLLIPLPSPSGCVLCGHNRRQFYAGDGLCCWNHYGDV